MIRKFARFEVSTENLDATLKVIRAFVDEVGRKEGGTATYHSFQDVDHPTRFTHFMEFRTPAAESYHQKTAWCKRFVDALYPLCTSPPEFSTVHLVGTDG